MILLQTIQYLTRYLGIILQTKIANSAFTKILLYFPLLTS